MISSHTYSNGISLIFGDREIFKIMEIRKEHFFCKYVLQFGGNQGNEWKPKGILSIVFLMYQVHIAT